MTVSGSYVLTTTYKSTDGILSHCKEVLDIAIVYLGVYHASSGVGALSDHNSWNADIPMETNGDIYPTLLSKPGGEIFFFENSDDLPSAPDRIMHELKWDELRF